MEMSNLRSELHVAQQSRRETLRAQQDSDNNPFSVSSVYANHVRQMNPSEGLGNMGFTASDLCPQMASTHSREIPGGFSNSADGCGPQGFSTWKSIGSDWATSHGPMFVGEGLSSSSVKLIGSTSPLLQQQNRKPCQEFYGNLANGDPVYPKAVHEFGACPSLVPESVSKDMEEERLLLPVPYAGQLRRPSDGCPGRSNDVGANDYSTTQAALSLSLSSVPPQKLAAIDFTGDGCFQESRNLSTVLGRSAHKDIGGSATTPGRLPGPLGPFTGYAIILRSSKFLRPAQQILEDVCFAARPRHDGAYTSQSHDDILEEVRVSGEDYQASTQGSVTKINDSGSSSGTNIPPENLQTRARLLFLQDEVSKRYSHYYQQIHMVLSSFETVGGLTSATPYVSLAVRSVSKHFRFLKNAIADHLKSLRNALGHDCSAPAPSSLAEERGFLMPRAAASSSLQEGGHHVWRPQRGLPERAVAILRAWLFDHFLHPYPTDTDKHMLASQTGLTRSQVSNWFINARVRIWKPMVEEIHMLETKSHAGETRPSPRTAAASDALKQATASSTQGQHDGSDVLNQDKRSRIEYQTSMGLGGSVVGYGPGPVSLTLGLRQSSENAQLVPPENRHLRHNFEAQFFRDFVG